MPVMTPAQTRAHGVMTPSLPQLLLTAMLRAFVELVLNVVSTLRMRPSRLPAECHTDVPPAALPEETNDTQKEELAAQHRSPLALMLRSAASLRVSKHEGVLTTLSHTSPSPSVSHATRAIHLPLLRRWRQEFGRELPPPPKAGEVDCAPLRARRRGLSPSTAHTPLSARPDASRDPEHQG